MAYADYEFYINEYSGTAEGAYIPSDVFVKYSNKASEYLDALTVDKISVLVPDYVSDYINQKVKMSACAIAECLYRHDTIGGRASESNDGYSVSYESRNLEEDMSNTAFMYLASTGLMYRGIG